jgi:hypothetical protein
VVEIESNLEDQMEKEHIEWDPGDFMGKAVKWEMEEHKDLSFGEAFAQAQRKYPGMAQRLQDQTWGKWPPKQENNSS